MELFYIAVGIFAVWLVRKLHQIRGREQEEANQKVAFTKWATEQQDPHIVSMVQNFMSEKRFDTWEEAVAFAEQTLKTTPQDPPSESHASDKKETPS